MGLALDEMPSNPAYPPLSEAGRRVGSSVIRELYAVTERPGVISLAGGMPAPETFPAESVHDAVGAVLGRDAATALQYGATEGYGPLREWVAGDYGVDVSHVTITAGSQQGLDLVARALVEPGDVVVSADPGYPGAIQAFRLAGAQLVGIPCDGEGLVVDVLADRLAAGLRPQAAYLVANLSNPTGATLSDERRDQLVALAERYGFWVVDDDPYKAIRWAGVPPASLAARSGHVITLGSASKVLCPGLRVGHVIAAPPVSATVAQIKQAADVHSSTLSQRIVHELVTRPGFLDDRLVALPAVYRARAEAMTEALGRCVGDAFEFAEPEGGFFVWGRLVTPAGVAPDTTRLLGLALDAGVAFVPGPAFAVSSSHDAWLRLSFATPSPEEIDEGIGRLATALRRFG